MYRLFQKTCHSKIVKKSKQFQDLLEDVMSCGQNVDFMGDRTPLNYLLEERNTLKNRMMSKWFDRQGCDYFLASHKVLLFTDFELFSETK